MSRHGAAFPEDAFLPRAVRYEIGAFCPSDSIRLGGELTVGERESCEALTSRSARLNDFLLQRVLRTLDEIELIDEGSPLDRLQRAEARRLIPSAERWRELRLLRNAIAHDYLVESADRILHESLACLRNSSRRRSASRGMSRTKAPVSRLWNTSAGAECDDL